MFIRRLLRYLSIFFIAAGILLTVSYVLLRQPVVQTYIAQKITGYLSTKWNTTVHISGVNIEPFRKIVLEGIFITDQNKDTLLFAEQLKVNISAIKLLDRDLRISEISLYNGKLYLKRTLDDDHFNYQFIVDSFKPAENDEPKQELDWELALQTLELVDIDLNFLDEHASVDVHVQAGKLHLLADELDLVKKQIFLNKIYVENTHVDVRHLIGLPVFETKMQGTEEVLVATAQAIPSKFEWNIYADELHLQKSSFSYNHDNFEPHDKGIDFNHILVDDIQIRAEKLSLEPEGLAAKVVSFSASEQSGFQVKDLNTQLFISNKQMIFDSLLLITKNSRVTDFLQFSYDGFSDFKDFENRVRLKGELHKSKVSFRDINYFAHVLSAVAHNTVYLTGDVSGFISNLRGRDLQMNLGTRSYFSGDLTMRGLPNIADTYISFRVNNVRTTAQEIRKIYPPIIIPKEIDRMGRLTFRGEFNGFIYDFVANGNLYSDIGQLSSDINLKINRENNLSSYSGNFSTKALNLGKMFNNEALLGPVTLQAKVKGQGLEIDRLKADFTLDLQSIVLKNYEFKDIAVNGALDKKNFEGFFAIDDKNLVLDFEGSVNFNGKQPVFHASTTISKANLMPLNITKEDLRIRTVLETDFQGGNIDDLLGHITLYNTQIIKDTVRTLIDSVKLVSRFSADGLSKVLELQSDIAEAKIKGIYNFSEMPAMLTGWFDHYFRTGALEANGNGGFQGYNSGNGNQHFSFTAAVKNPAPITDIFLPELQVPQRIDIEGDFSSHDYKSSLTATVPGASYNKIDVEAVKLSMTSNEQDIKINLEGEKVLLEDQLLFRDINFKTQAAEDVLAFSLKMDGSTDRDKIDFSGTTSRIDSFIVTNFLPTQILLNNKKWNVSKDNEILISSETLIIPSFKIFSGNQSLELTSYMDIHRNTVGNIHFDNLDIRDFSHPFINNPVWKPGGRINGTIRVVDVFDEPFLTTDINIQHFSIANDTIGNVFLVSDFLTNSSRLNIDLKLNGRHHELQLYGTYDVKDDRTPINARVQIKKITVPFFEKYLTQYVSNLSGTADGSLGLRGSLQKPIVEGQLRIQNAGATVNYLNTHYTFDDEKITFHENWMDIGEITIFDKDMNRAAAGGELRHNYFRKPSLDVYVKTENFLFLNTNANQNKEYYGIAYGGGTVLFSGPFNNIDIYIAARTRPGTNLSIPLSGSNEVGEHNFYRFINIAKDTTGVSAYKKKTSGFNLNFDLDVTPDATVQIIFDQQAGDIIKGRGYGNLRLEVDNFGTFVMLGTYEITSGDYLFTFQNIINKRFLIESGSKIVWTGNPYEAQLAVNAIYETKSSPYNLVYNVVSTTETGRQAARDRIPVFLYLNLTGSLLQPTIDFDIRMHDIPSPIRAAVESEMRLLKEDENELNKQVFGLLVFNQFLPTRSFANSSVHQPNLATGVNNTVSEFLSNQLSMYFSDLFSHFVTEMEVGVKYRSYETTLEGGYDDFEDPLNRKELQLDVSKKFFKDRVNVNIGGNFDFGSNPNVEEQQKISNIAGDFIIEYDISADGKIKVRGFRKNDYDMFAARNRGKTGLGLSYREEYDNIDELLKKIYSRIIKKRETPEPVLPAPDLDNTYPLPPPQAQY